MGEENKARLWVVTRKQSQNTELKMRVLRGLAPPLTSPFSQTQAPGRLV